MLVAYATGHGYGHMTRLCEVLRAVRERAPALPITFVGALPERLVRRAVPGPLSFRAVATDAGLVQRDALEIDEAASARRCAEVDGSWDRRAAVEVEFLRQSQARLVVSDIPALPFEAAARAGVPAVGVSNFSWDWIYRHLARRQPALAASADRAARAYATAALLLELPFAGDLSAFPRRERVGFVARRPRAERGETRRRLGLDERPAVLVSFGGVGLPGLTPRVLASEPDFRFLWPGELETDRLDALGLRYPDVVAAADAVVTKPGYGIVTDAIAAGTRLVYTERGDFPEYPIMVGEMTRFLACAHVGNDDLRAGRIGGALRRVLAMPVPPRPALDGAERAAERLLALLG
jgi:UDP:flavonoid glycosyltransferase YjiC (YdhE family)